MAIYPEAELKLIPKHNTGVMAKYSRMNLHVAVSEAKSLYGFFAGVAACSHFYVRKDGTVEQYIDTKYKSKADLQGNSSTISVETQGGVKNANSEPWTAAQIEAMGKLFAWAVKTHGIKQRLATTSILDAESSRGLSYHRLGVTPWRVSNGAYYSRSVGKICPGAGKITQIPEVLEASKASGGSSGSSKPSTGSNKPTTPVKPSKPSTGGSSTYKGDSIVDYLNSLGKASSFAARKKLAEAQGIKNYAGTAAQNLALLKKLRAGESPKKPQTSKPSSVYRGDSIVDYLNSLGKASSFAARKKLAEAQGIKNYAGTAAQNLTLLKKLRGF